MFLAAVAVALTPEGRVRAEALSLLVEVQGIDAAPRRIARDVVVAPIDYAGPAGTPRRADLYCAAAAPSGARLLLVHGLVEAGKDDLRLVHLARAFARHRFLVMVPDFPGMKALRAAPEDRGEVGAALRAIAGLDVCVPPDDLAGGGAPPRVPGQTGVVAFSYGAGPTLLALGRPGAARADFAVLFGGYWDIDAVLLYLTTGRRLVGERPEDAEVVPEGRWVVLHANAAALPDAADRDALETIARLRRRDPRAPIESAAATLGPSGRAVLALVSNTDPQRFPALLAAVDPALRARLDALSPAKAPAATLAADIYLLHGRGDAVIPWTESVRLRHGLRTTGTVRLELLGGFRHARPEGPAGRAWWARLAAAREDAGPMLDVLREILERRAFPAATLTGGAPLRR